MIFLLWNNCWDAIELSANIGRRADALGWAFKLLRFQFGAICKLYWWFFEFFSFCHLIITLVTLTMTSHVQASIFIDHGYHESYFITSLSDELKIKKQSECSTENYSHVRRIECQRRPESTLRCIFQSINMKKRREQVEHHRSPQFILCAFRSIKYLLSSMIQKPTGVAGGWRMAEWLRAKNIFLIKP